MYKRSVGTTSINEPIVLRDGGTQFYIGPCLENYLIQEGDTPSNVIGGDSG